MSAPVDIYLTSWQFDDKDVSVPSQNKDRLNILGMVSPDCKYEGFDTTDSITGGWLAEWLDNFSKRIDRPTFVVLDNASIHRKGKIARKIPEWKERDLYIFYIPPYSPHLNIAETVWSFLRECGLSLTIIAAGVHFMKHPEKFWMVSEVNMSLTFLMLLDNIFLI